MWVAPISDRLLHNTVELSEAHTQTHIDAATKCIEGISWYNAVAKTDQWSNHDWPVTIYASYTGTEPKIHAVYGPASNVDMASHVVALHKILKRQHLANNPVDGSVAFATNLHLPRLMVDMSPEQAIVYMLEKAWIFAPLVWRDTVPCNRCGLQVKAGQQDIHVYWGACNMVRPPISFMDDDESIHGRITDNKFVIEASKHIINGLHIRPKVATTLSKRYDRDSLLSFIPYIRYPTDVARVANMFIGLAESEVVDSGRNLSYAGMNMEEFIRHSLGEDRVRELAESSKVY